MPLKIDLLNPMNTMKLDLRDGSSITLVPGTTIEYLPSGKMSVIALLPDGYGDLIEVTPSDVLRVRIGRA